MVVTPVSVVGLGKMGKTSKMGNIIVRWITLVRLVRRQ